MDVSTGAMHQKEVHPGDTMVMHAGMFESFYVRVNTIYGYRPIGGRSQIQVHTTNGPCRFTAPGFPWWSSVQVLTDIYIYLEDITRHILYRIAYRARGLISARGEAESRYVTKGSICGPI